MMATLISAVTRVSRTTVSSAYNTEMSCADQRTCHPLLSSEAVTADDVDLHEMSLTDLDLTYEPPSERMWFHGRLDRQNAEDILRISGKPGSYLIRESDSKPGSYVLSFLGQSGFNHFRITAIYGDYYIGGRKFTSLHSLIAFYTVCNDLLKHERLMYPIPAAALTACGAISVQEGGRHTEAQTRRGGGKSRDVCDGASTPPEPPPRATTSGHAKVVAILPYTKMPETDELTFDRGDIFHVHSDCGNGWLWVLAHRSGEQGLLFRDLTEPLDDHLDANIVYPWFHDSLTKNEAVDLLVKGGPGCFLVRPSDNSPGDYSLFFHVNNQIQRFRIEKKTFRYSMGGRMFDCLEAIINRYKTEHIVDGYTLLTPINAENRLKGVIQRREVKHANEIYATLMECREMQSLKKNQGIKMQGYLYRRNEKNKKWKLFYSVLQSQMGESQLFFYDNPKRMKPKSLVDLSYAYYYPVHDSFFDRPFCFQVIEKSLPCITTVTYLCAATLDSFQDWVQSVRPVCISQLCRVTRSNSSLRELRTLSIHVQEASRLPSRLVSQPFCVLSVSGVILARTRSRPLSTNSSADVVWNEEFVFDDLPPDVSLLNISVWHKTKKSRDIEFADVVIDLTNLNSGETIDEWLALQGMSPLGDWGSVHVQLTYCQDLVMPCEEYLTLKELLFTLCDVSSSPPALAATPTTIATPTTVATPTSLNCVCVLASISLNVDLKMLANALLRVFRWERREIDLLHALCVHEIWREQSHTSLFRSSSLVTTLVGVYMRTVCSDFLKMAVSDVVLKVIESRASCELNPSRVDSQFDACSNAEYLLSVLDKIADSIFQAAEECPRSLRYLCGCLQRAVTHRWPRDKHVRARVVSGFIFLRLICPAVINPHQFGLVTECPSPEAVRSLVMIAKCLQSLANISEPGLRHSASYMGVVDPFIIKYRERMLIFLDQLSNVQTKPEPEDLFFRCDPASDLAIIHHFCSQNLSQIQEMAKQESGARQLVTVIQMLDNHKNMYREMMTDTRSQINPPQHLD